MKILISLGFLVVSMVVSFALVQTTHAEESFTVNNTSVAPELPADKIEIKDNGRIWVNGQRLSIILQYDGTQLPFRGEHILASAGRNPGFFVGAYPDGPPSSQGLTQHLVVVDTTGKKVRLSNVLDTGLEFQWGDNNYVLFDHNTMYFGIYSPRRMQFVYRDGRLAEDKGPWRGPAKPEQYIMPKNPGPCFNVTSEADCLEELEREQERAAIRTKQKHRANHKAKPPVSAPQPTVSH